MNRRRFVWILAAAVVAICAALYLASERNLQPDTRGAALLPALGAELDTVTEIGIRKGNTTPSVTVHRMGDKWTVLQRADYPADLSKVHRLLLALSDARIVEEKTSDPANYATIGVEDLAGPSASGAEVTLSAKDGKHAVIVGKPIGEGNFARRAGEAKSYSIAPSISVDAEPKAWIDSRLIDIPVASIQSIVAKLASGPGYTLKRLKPNEEGFALEGIPPGRKALDAKALAPSSSAITGLTAEDVAAAGDIDFGKPSQAVFTMSDGNVLTVTGTAAGDKRWIELEATKDTALGVKAQNRAFEVATYRYDAIFRPLEQLLVPKETKPPDSGKQGNAGSKSSPATKAAPKPKTPPSASP
jgi:Domain of unknown function (DUF4340)